VVDFESAVVPTLKHTIIAALVRFDGAVVPALPRLGRAVIPARVRLDGAVVPALGPLEGALVPAMVPVKRTVVPAPLLGAGLVPWSRTVVPAVLQELPLLIAPEGSLVVVLKAEGARGGHVAASGGPVGAAGSHKGFTTSEARTAATRPNMLDVRRQEMDSPS
jgi:hypothetical protein